MRMSTAKVISAFAVVGVAIILAGAIKSCRDNIIAEQAAEGESVTPIQSAACINESSASEYEWEAEFRQHVSEQVDVEPERIKIGRCRLTVYTPYCDGGKWEYATATGVTSEHLTTCAVDLDVIPYGSNVIITGNGHELRLKAVDCGSGVKGKQVDIFFDGTERLAMSWLDEIFGDYADVEIEVIA